MEYNKIKQIEYYLMFLFLAVSGGEFYCMTFGRYFIPLFVLCSLGFHIKKYHRVRFFKTARYILIGWAYSAFHYFLLYPNHIKNTFLPSSLMLIGAYLFLSSYSISRFKRIYLNTVYVMAIVSIVILIIVQLGIISPSLNTGEEPTYMFLTHNLGRTEISRRLAGIYWEPGAYQIILNMVFFLHLNDFISMKINRYDRIKLGVILFAVLLTASTAGYMFLAALLFFLGMIKLKVNFNLGKLLVVIFISAVAFVGLYKSSAIQKKILEKEQAYANSSYSIRLADNVAMYIMISERPIIGWGQDSVDLISTGEKLGARTFSNGILFIIVCLGFPFFFIYLYYLYHGIKRLFPNRNTIFLISLFLFMNSFEVFWFYPAAFILFFLMDNPRIEKPTSIVSYR